VKANVTDEYLKRKQFSKVRKVMVLAFKSKINPEDPQAPSNLKI
jgi:hypothetical protein